LQIKLSQRKRVPALFLDESGYAFPLWDYQYVSTIERSQLKLDEVAVHVLGELKKGFYKPPFSLKGKVVLDIGACCGETAWYYQRLGASHVSCIEINPERIMNLRYNRLVAGLDITIISEPFCIDHLVNLDYDFIKCDVEGQEVILLNYMKQFDNLKPCVLEVHGPELYDKFTAEGFRLVGEASDGFYIMANYSA